MRGWPVLMVAIALAGCSGGTHQDNGRDPSQLDPAMETQARSLEERANLAAAQVEREALAELERVEAEARAAATAESAQAAGSANSANANPTNAPAPRITLPAAT